jgi:hypothetical protein
MDTQENAWNGRTLKWLGILLVLLVGCGLASCYCHLYLEDNGDDQPDNYVGGAGDSGRWGGLRRGGRSSELRPRPVR